MILIRKLFRDVRLALFVMLLLLFAFQLLWAKVTQRIAGEVLGRFVGLGVDIATLRSIIFTDSGKIIQTLMGGETIALERGADMMSIAYVHPLTQLILCVWAIGRAAGALAGEIDRGTMELLLAQPIRRSHVVLAHLAIDAVSIPALALALWSGTCVGVHLVGLADSNVEQLRVDPLRFAPGTLSVMALAFAVSGATMAISSMGRLRGEPTLAADGNAATMDDLPLLSAARIDFEGELDVAAERLVPPSSLDGGRRGGLLLRPVRFLPPRLARAALIRDNRTGGILFLGQVADPSE